jgi:hypothetical protein
MGIQVQQYPGRPGFPTDRLRRSPDEVDGIDRPARDEEAQKIQFCYHAVFKPKGHGPISP